MNPNLRDRILRKLDTLSDERGYQALDYVEFLEARYAEKPADTGNLFRQFTEGLEDKLRAGKVSASTIVDTMGILNKAVGMLEGVAAAGKSVANDIVAVAQRAATPADGAAGASATPGPTPGGGTSGAASASGTSNTATGSPPTGGTGPTPGAPSTGPSSS